MRIKIFYFFFFLFLFLFFKCFFFFYCLVLGKVSTILYNEQKLFSQGEETRCNCSKILPLRRENWTQMPAKFFLRTRRLDTNDNTIISPGREDSTQMVAKFFTRIWVSDSNGSKIHSWMRTGYKILSSRGDVAIQKTSKFFPHGRKAIKSRKILPAGGEDSIHWQK